MVTPRSSPPRRSWFGAVLFAALGTLLVVLVILLVRHSTRHRAGAPERDVAQVEAPRSWQALPAAAPEPPVPADAPPEPPIIDEVTVEKQEVCEGEENLVTVKAHTPAGRDDAFLHYVIGSTPGRSVPVRAHLLPSGVEIPAPKQVLVFGRNNVVTAVPIPSYTIKKCRPERSLTLRTSQLPNAPEEYEVQATVREIGPSPPLRVTAYRWNYGDGASEVTSRPVAVHRFVPRDPDALYAEYLITCEAVGSDGRTVVGRTALSLRNTEVENLRFNDALMLSVELTPRFPQADSRGEVLQRVRLYHHRSASVRLERARITYVGAGEKDAEPARDVSVVEVLGTNDVPPGQGVERAFRLDTAAHPDTVMVDYDLEGHTADGIRALAHFSVMRPPRPPTAETGDEVVDRLFKKKILRARERLGKQFVNDEDLLQLERDGAFADLEQPANEGETPTEPPISASAKAGVASKLAARR